MIGRIRSAASTAYRRARASVRGSAIVVTYHRVADLDSDPMLLAVTTARFAEQIEALAQRHEFSTFGDLLRDMEAGRPLGARRVVLTFDDGYADNLHTAKPILERFGAPATVFVAVAAIDSDSELWWDELERTILAPGELPARIEFELPDDNGRVFELGAASEFSSAEARLAAGWDITAPVTHPRQRLFLDLSAFIKGLSPAQRVDALATLRAVAGTPTGQRTTHRTLTSGELRQLEAGGSIEIGAHTVNHPLLSTLDLAEQRTEILGGKQGLEELLGHDVISFSYPYGTEGDYTAETVSAVRESGLLGACTTRFGTVVPWSDRYEVPRCPSANVSGREFAEQVERWFDAGR